MSVDNDILILEAKINKASERIAQAEKQYKRSVQKLEKQKKAVEIAHGDISRVKINIANQLAMLQKLKEFIKRGIVFFCVGYTVADLVLKISGR